MNRIPRMTEWLIVSLLLLAAIWVLAPQQIGVSLYKLSLITSAAWVGYWIDRSLFPYARPDDLSRPIPFDRDIAMIRRAIVVGCAMLAASLGA